MGPLKSHGPHTTLVSVCVNIVHHPSLFQPTPASLPTHPHIHYPSVHLSTSRESALATAGGWLCAVFCPVLASVGLTAGWWRVLVSVELTAEETLVSVTPAWMYADSWAEGGV